MFKLRTLSGLLAFDAAARHASLTNAAHELGRTQSAISQQVKALEQHLGLELFARRPREISLTPEGRVLAKSVAAALGEIERTVTELSQKDDPNILRLTTYQSFAIHWLIPRLPSFSLLYPEIDVRINADDQRRDLRVEGYDIAIRIGSPPAGAEVLLPEQFGPVYAPDISPSGSISKSDIGRAPMLAHRQANIWHDWLELNEVLVDQTNIGTDYSHSGLLVQAASAGGGVALAPLVIAAEAITSGRLHCIRGKPLATDYCYYIETARNPASDKVALFVDWVRAEMARTEAALAEYIN